VAAFVAAIHRALALYRQPAPWRRLQQTGMHQSFDWSDSAAHYLKLYSTQA
jgi:starch synthase